MVSLAARCESGTAYNDLHHQALWYPHVPEGDFSINEETFVVPRHVAVVEYEPLCFTMFGGPDGSYLGSLTSMSVYGISGAIDFCYKNSVNVPPECRIAGRYFTDQHVEPICFDIDGPGGEVVDSLTVHNSEYPSRRGALWYHKSGFMQSLEVSRHAMPICTLCRRVADMIWGRAGLDEPWAQVSLHIGPQLGA